MAKNAQGDHRSRLRPCRRSQLPGSGRKPLALSLYMARHGKIDWTERHLINSLNSAKNQPQCARILNADNTPGRAPSPSPGSMWSGHVHRNTPLRLDEWQTRAASEGCAWSACTAAMRSAFPHMCGVDESRLRQRRHPDAQHIVAIRDIVRESMTAH